LSTSSSRSGSSSGPERVRAGRVTSPHGLDGSVKVAEARFDLLAVGSELHVAGRTAKVERLAGTEAKPIIRLSGCSDRNAAEELRGAVLLVDRDSVPPLGDDEWWASDLIGCSVVDGSTAVGEVVGVLGLPSCEALEVDRGPSSQLLVPIVGDAVRSVDVASRRIDIDLAFLGEESS